MRGGDDGRGGGGGPLCVLLHGFGAPGDDLAPLAGVLGAPAGTRFVFPAAPLDLGAQYFGGRAWWMIDLARVASGAPRDIRRVPPGLIDARAHIDALLRRLARPGVPLVLGGFSQGAMLSLDVALHGDHALAGLVLMSGTHIAADEWAARTPARRGLPVFMSHGRGDPLLPFATAEGLRDALTQSGLCVEWLPFDGGHEIPQHVIRGAGAFVRRLLG
jgi:phospholipase/carboxylesterase